MKHSEKNSTRLVMFFRKYWHMPAAAVFGLLIFLGIYGIEPLRFSGIGWTVNGFDGQDITQHQAGWMFFRNSPWTFPLCKALYLGYPEGTSVSYTDSIPIAAILFKLLSPILPETFQYFGLYTCFGFMMQGLFASALLFRHTNNSAFSAAGSTLYVTASCFIERCFRHTALSSHWLLLAALLLYFHDREKSENRILLLLRVLLLCLSLGIHPYLFVMCFGICAMSAAEKFFIKGERLTALFDFGICLSLSVLFGFVIGLFGSEVSPETGFGQYSLNLNALFNPYSGYHNRWSAILSAREVFPGQNDGTYYLGLPLTAVFIITCIFRFLEDPDHIRRFFRNNPGLCILLLAFTVYSISNIVTFDDKILFHFKLPDALITLLNYFRSSGRFFFIPYYCIITTAMAGVFSLCKRRTQSSVLFCLILMFLQTAEISPALKDLRQYFGTRYEDLNLSEDWNQIADEYDSARTFDALSDRTLAFWLAKKGFRTDMMISAPVHMNTYWKRTRSERDRLRESLAEGTELLDPDTIYIISAETGTNRSFPDGDSLDEYIAMVRESYRGKARLLNLGIWLKRYWILCPLR